MISSRELFLAVRQVLVQLLLALPSFRHRLSCEGTSNRERRERKHTGGLERGQRGLKLGLAREDLCRPDADAAEDSLRAGSEEHGRPAADHDTGHCRLTTLLHVIPSELPEGASDAVIIAALLLLRRTLGPRPPHLCLDGAL